MVASSTHPVRVRVTVDGKPNPDAIIHESRLHTLFDSTDHVITRWS